MFAIEGHLGSKKELVRKLIRAALLMGLSITLLSDDDEGSQAGKESLDKEFGRDNVRVHVWDCGVAAESGGTQTAEFEDNFSLSELVEAANLVGDGDLIGVEDLSAGGGQKKISKVLEKVYAREYSGGWSKRKLGEFLGQIALRKIREDELRGRADGRYEFEDQIEKLLGTGQGA